MSVVLRGGRIIDRDGERTLDVEVGDDGRIAAVGTGLSGDAELDASGCVISPGFVDLHVHLREPRALACPGLNWESGIESAWGCHRGGPLVCAC